MPSPQEISQLAANLHDEKLINIDASGREFVQSRALQGIDSDALADWYVIGGSHYVVVAGLQNELPEQVVNQ